MRSRRRRSPTRPWPRPSRCFEWRKTPPLETLRHRDWRVERWAALGSTNDEARARALAGDPGRLWMLADEQTAGPRPAGPGVELATGQPLCERASRRPLRAGGRRADRLCRRRRVERARSPISASPAPRLNGRTISFADGAKLAGLLVEGVTPPGRRLAAIVGIGVNVASAPEGSPIPPTSLPPRRATRSRRARCSSGSRARFDEALVDLGARRRLRRNSRGLACSRRRPRRADPRRRFEWRTRRAVRGLDARGRLLITARERRIETVESADVTLISRRRIGRAAAHATKAAPEMNDDRRIGVRAARRPRRSRNELRALRLWAGNERANG